MILSLMMKSHRRHQCLEGAEDINQIVLLLEFVDFNLIRLRERSKVIEIDSIINHLRGQLPIKFNVQ